MQTLFLTGMLVLIAVIVGYLASYGWLLDL